jgi:hypothetical protein
MIFDRLEFFFLRVEVCIEVPLNQEMVDTALKIMVEVLNIIGIATQQINQNQISERFLCK